MYVVVATKDDIGERRFSVRVGGPGISPRPQKSHRLPVADAVHPPSTVDGGRGLDFRGT